MSKSVSWHVVAHHCFFYGDINALFGANIQNWSACFGTQNLVYLKNLKPWLKKTKSKLIICHVILFFYAHWNRSWKDGYWKAIRWLVLFLCLNIQTPLVFHIIHKRPSTFQGVTSRNIYMSYGVLNLLKILEVKRFKNLYMNTIHMLMFWMLHLW